MQRVPAAAINTFIQKPREKVVIMSSLLSKFNEPGAKIFEASGTQYKGFQKADQFRGVRVPSQKEQARTKVSYEIGMFNFFDMLEGRGLRVYVSQAKEEGLFNRDGKLVEGKKTDENGNVEVVNFRTTYKKYEEVRVVEDEVARQQFGSCITEAKTAKESASFNYLAGTIACLTILLFLKILYDYSMKKTGQTKSLDNGTKRKPKKSATKSWVQIAPQSEKNQRKVAIWHARQNVERCCEEAIEPPMKKLTQLHRSIMDYFRLLLSNPIILQDPNASKIQEWVTKLTPQFCVETSTIPTEEKIQFLLAHVGNHLVRNSSPRTQMESISDYTTAINAWQPLDVDASQILERVKSVEVSK